MSRLTLLVIAGLLAIGADGAPTFDVSSVKRNTQGGPANNWQMSPGQRDFRNSQIRALIRAAWGDNGLRIEGAPDWIVTERYDVLAKFPADTPPAAVELMLRELLRDRFKLAAHLEMRQVSIYALMMAREDRMPGPRLRPGLKECVPPWPGRTTTPPECGRGAGSGFVQVGAGTMAAFAQLLTEMQAAGQSVKDRTGQSGIFKIDLEFAPDAGAAQPEAAPSIFTALREQLGLKLEPARDDVSVLIVDHIERPTPD
jgi:uncharacterized protein (TIGR03435 family)